MNKIAELNDRMRAGLPFPYRGKVLLTRGVANRHDLADIFLKIKDFSDFTEDNDPYGEHDFGAFEIGNEKFFWKIDYYDNDLEYGSSDPANPEVTTRVLTIMLAEEY